MSDEARFATAGILDEAFFKANAKYLLSPKFRRRRMILAAVITALCLAEYAWFRNAAFLVILAIYWITYYPFTLWYQRSAVGTLTKRFRENYADGKCEMISACTEEGVFCENRSAGGALTVRYEHLHSLAVADHAMILMSKAGQFTVLFTDGLSEQEQKELRAYLCEKCPGIKVIR